jgi:hypothetical protein
MVDRLILQRAGIWILGAVLAGPAFAATSDAPASAPSIPQISGATQSSKSTSGAGPEAQWVSSLIKPYQQKVDQKLNSMTSQVDQWKSQKSGQDPAWMAKAGKFKSDVTAFKQNLNAYQQSPSGSWSTVKKRFDADLSQITSEYKSLTPGSNSSHAG